MENLDMTWVLFSLLILASIYLASRQTQAVSTEASDDSLQGRFAALGIAPLLVVAAAILLFQQSGGQEVVSSCEPEMLQETVSEAWHGVRLGLF